jgi:hypothetical protein
MNIYTQNACVSDMLWSLLPLWRTGITIFQLCTCGLSRQVVIKILCCCMKIIFLLFTFYKVWSKYFKDILLELRCCSYSDGRWLVLRKVGSFSLYTPVPLFIPVLQAPLMLSFWDCQHFIYFPAFICFHIVKPLAFQGFLTSGKKKKVTWKFEAFMTVKIQFKVLWVVTPYSVVVGYQCFRGPCCLHLLGSPLKHWYHTTTQKTLTWRHRESCLVSREVLTCGISYLAKNCHTNWAEWAGSLSW